MKIGDLVQYRGRKSTDPEPPGAWGETGVIIRLVAECFALGYDEDGVEYMNKHGDFITARRTDMEVVSESR